MRITIIAIIGILSGKIAPPPVPFPPVLDPPVLLPPVPLPLYKPFDPTWPAVWIPPSPTPTIKEPTRTTWLMLDSSDQMPSIIFDQMSGIIFDQAVNIISIVSSAQMNIFDQMSGIIFNRVFSCFDQVPSFDQVVSFDQVIPFLYLVLGLIIGYYFGRQTPSGSGSDSLRRFCETTITEPVVPAPAVKPVVTAPAVKANRGRERRRLAWENAPNEVCRKWEAGECRDGKNCRRIHERRQ